MSERRTRRATGIGPDFRIITNRHAQPPNTPSTKGDAARQQPMGTPGQRPRASHVSVMNRDTAILAGVMLAAAIIGLLIGASDGRLGAEAACRGGPVDLLAHGTGDGVCR
jgi:hypothetical protein